MRPLVAFLGLVHFRIPLPFLVFGGTGRGDQGGIEDRALAHRHAFLIEMGFDGLIDEVFCAANRSARSVRASPASGER